MSKKKNSKTKHNRLLRLYSQWVIFTVCVSPLRQIATDTTARQEQMTIIDRFVFVMKYSYFNCLRNIARSKYSADRLFWSVDTFSDDATHNTLLHWRQCTFYHKILTSWSITFDPYSGLSLHNHYMVLYTILYMKLSNYHTFCILSLILFVMIEKIDRFRRVISNDKRLWHFVYVHH